MAASLKALGQQIRKAREKKGITRVDMIRVVSGLYSEDLERLESGEKLLRREQLEALCQSLGVADKHWKPLFSTESSKRKKFEEFLEELLGIPLM